jgi:hypothetical protein
MTLARLMIWTRKKGWTYNTVGNYRYTVAILGKGNHWRFNQLYKIKNIPVLYFKSDADGAEVGFFIAI